MGGYQEVRVYGFRHLHRHQYLSVWKGKTRQNTPQRILPRTQLRPGFTAWQVYISGQSEVH